MVTAKDLRYLWIGLGCWAMTITIGLFLQLDRRYLVMFVILPAMLLFPLFLITMASWKRHFFVAGGVILMIAPLLIIFGPVFLASQSTASLLIQAGGNLRNSVLAMHNYHSDHGHFPPPAITATDETPLLSWRVLILPYLGEEKLYKEFHLNESWGSEHNRKLIPRMPDIYKSVGKVACPDHHTFIQVIVGPGTVFDPQHRVTLGQIASARGNDKTITAAQGGHPVIWTKPEDISFTPEGGIGPIGGQFPASSNYVGVNIVLADGSVRSLRPPFPMKALREAVQWQSRKLLEIDWE